MQLQEKINVKEGCDIILTRKVGNLSPGCRAKVISVHRYDSKGDSAGLLYLRVEIQGGQRSCRNTSNEALTYLTMITH